MARKRKITVSVTEQSIQQNTLTVSPVALLIDGENVIAPKMIAHILVEAGKMGSVVIRQVYGNWISPSMHPWKEIMVHYALEQMNNTPVNAGRNAGDIALVIGAMDLLYRGVKHFCLVAGDSDYLPLILRLRQDGCTVLGIGMPNASQTLKESCNRFLTIEQLTLKPAVSKFTLPSPPSIPNTRPTEELLTLLANAYRQITKADDNGWILLSVLGKTLRDHNPNFEDVYGKKRLSTLIEQCSNLFEVRKRKVGNGQVDEVRIRKQNS